MVSKAEEIAALEAMLASLEDADDSDPLPPIKEGNREVRIANEALRARSYRASERCECRECGVVHHRFKTDLAHETWRSYCSVNCIDDAIEKYREAATLALAMAHDVATLRDKSRANHHAEAWARLTQTVETFSQKYPKKSLHLPDDSGTTTEQGASPETSTKDKKE